MCGTGNQNESCGRIPALIVPGDNKSGHKFYIFNHLNQESKKQNEGYRVRDFLGGCVYVESFLVTSPMAWLNPVA